MTPQIAIQNLIDTLKADKTLAQPWKNYAMSDAMRLQAVIAMAGQAPASQHPATSHGCICLPGQKAQASCPVHGLLV